MLHYQQIDGLNMPVHIWYTHTLSLFLDKTNRYVSHELSLRDIDDLALNILSDCDWLSIASMRDEQEVRARMAGFNSIFVKELQRQKFMARQQQSPAPEGATKKGWKVSSSSSSSHSASSRLGIGSSANLIKVSGDLRRAEASTLPVDRPARDRNELIEELISNGQMMMRVGVFSTPKLRWRRDEVADPQERRVLDMIGFLLDAYDKKAWWWEVFEMNRKLMLAGAIILIPTEGGKQIAFAVLISTISLYVSLRTCPYIRENLGKLHVMSLTAQCITLFYALLLEVQELTSETLSCSGGTCKRKISDVVMDYLLTSLQVSVFALPVLLLIRDRGGFRAIWGAVCKLWQQIRKGLGFSDATSRAKSLWPTAPVRLDSAASSTSSHRKSSQVSKISLILC